MIFLDVVIAEVRDVWFFVFLEAQSIWSFLGPAERQCHLGIFLILFCPKFSVCEVEM